jgi:hypothetical protein
VINPFVPLTLAVLVLGQTPPEADDAARQERLAYMQEQAAQFKLFREGADEPLPLKEQSVLRYSNPERDSGTWDGATFLWLEGGRPIAALSFGIRRPKDAVFRELTSFVQTPLVCRKGDAPVWSPQSGGLASRPFAEAPDPAESAPGRLTQMRSLARRFSGYCTYKEDTTQLRVLPQPLYRYADEKQGLVDGALFALVVSNDPEMFLMLEAIRAKEAKESDKPRWHYSLARMSSLKQTVQLDEKEIWTVPGFYTIPAAERKTGPYIESYQGMFTSALPAP